MTEKRDVTALPLREIEVPDSIYRQMQIWADLHDITVEQLAEAVLGEYLDKHIGEFTNGA